MTLLLTSAGITNASIADALIRELKTSVEETKVGLISTPAEVEPGNKDWFVNQFKDLNRFGFNWIDMIDISNASVDWKKRLEPCNVIYVSGGNSFYALDQARKTGFGDWLKEALETKTYVGVSAGSMIMGKTIDIANAEPADPNVPGITDLTGLGYVDFDLSPHSPDLVSYIDSQSHASKTGNKVYALDDMSAVLVNHSEIAVISEGRYKVFGG